MRWVLHVASMGEMKNAEIQNFHRKIWSEEPFWGAHAQIGE
jgi:hypothetical protein